MTHRCTIRPAVAADAPALTRLRYEFRSSLDRATESEPEFVARCERWITARLRPGTTWHCWAAESEGLIFGMAWLSILEKLPNPVGESERLGYVTSVYVRPGQRSQGIGSALLEQCLDECRRQAVDAVVLWPTARSRPLYERHGFAVRDDLLELRLGSAPRHDL